MTGYDATAMRRGRKELQVVGDRILVKSEGGESTTKVGLVLPASVAEKEDVRGGTVVAMGPGNPLPPPQEEGGEPWKEPYHAPRYLPMQVEIGDYALFFRKAAIEITFEDEAFLVVTHGAVLVLVRETKVPDGLPDEI